METLSTPLLIIAWALAIAIGGPIVLGLLILFGTAIGLLIGFIWAVLGDAMDKLKRRMKK